MDAEPKALRPYILVTTAFVVIGVAAGALLWLVSFDNARRAAVADVGEVEPHPVDFPARVSAADRERLRALGGRLVDPAEHARGGQVEEELVAAGEDAVPVLLTAMNDVLASKEGLRDRVTTFHFLMVDRILFKIRLDATPGDPAAPVKDPPDPAWILHRARTWFAWWDAREAKR